MGRVLVEAGVMYEELEHFQPDPERVPVFRYLARHIPNNGTYRRRVIVFSGNRSDFLRLLDHWNSILPNIWQYIPDHHWRYRFWEIGD